MLSHKTSQGNYLYNIFFESDINTIHNGNHLKMFNNYNNEVIVSVISTGTQLNQYTVESRVLLDSSMFVYGVDVEDLHILKKDTIYTTGISAIQELDFIMQNHIKLVETSLNKMSETITHLEEQLQKYSDQQSESNIN